MNIIDCCYLVKQYQKYTGCCVPSVYHRCLRSTLPAYLFFSFTAMSVGLFKLKPGHRTYCKCLVKMSVEDINEDCSSLQHISYNADEEQQ